MATYKLHCFAESGNTFKVASYLNCANLSWQAVPVDYFRGETREGDWRTNVNSMGEAPVLEVDGKALTQSGSILQYLADTTGHFAGEPDDRYEILRWILFDNHKFTSYFATYRFMYSLASEPPEPAVIKFLKDRADGALAVVDKHLIDSHYIVGSKPTIADFSLSGYMFYPRSEHGYDLENEYPNIFAWTERLQALAGWTAPYELMPRAKNPD